MRMAKRIATGILAAAMALSMLTACGGGGSSSPSGNGNTNTANPGTSNSENKDDTNSGNTGNNNSNKPNNGGADNTGSTSVWINTQTYKANQILKSNKQYIDSDWSFDGESIQYTYSQNAQKSYARVYLDETDGVTNYALLIADGSLYLTEPKAVEGKNVVLRVAVDDFDQQTMMEETAQLKMMLATLLTPDNPSEITVEPQKQFGASVYHAESYKKTLDGTKVMVTGYYQKDTLKFLKVSDETNEAIKIKFNAFSATPNEELLKLPTNCQIGVKIDNGKVYDAKGTYLGEESDEMKEFLS